MSRVIVFFADGMEECEGLLVVDLLRRAGSEVVTASVNSSTAILTSHGIRLEADCTAEALDYSSADMLVLPGGLKGTENLASNTFVREKVRWFASEKKAAAICAAPSIFASLGLLEGRNATVHPGFEEKMYGANLTHCPVTVDGNLITGRSLGAAIPFALELIRQLEGTERAESVAKAICYET